MYGRDGFMNIIPRDLLQKKNPYDGEIRVLKFYNGSKIHGYSATDPDKLRGNNFHGAWWDEAAYCNNATALWDEIQRVVRVGKNIFFLITTTPNHLKFLRDISEDPRTHETTGGSFENTTMPENVKAAWRKKYELPDGTLTKMGQQELEGHYVNWGHGALWSMEQIERDRVKYENVPNLSEIVVAVDPAGTSHDESSETGIVVMGLDGMTGHMYLLDDLSCREKPEEWARIACEAYHQWDASFVVGEVNFGSDMVGAMINGYDSDVEFREVRASRGKVMRARPISLLSEQGKIHHAGEFPVLERQLVEWTDDIGEKSPDRLDAFTWAATCLSQIEPRVLIGGA